MGRRGTVIPGIGDRIETRRKQLGYSLRFAASKAGISHTSLGRIERGEQSADNRFVIASIAEALRCSVAELTGQTASPIGQDEAETGGGAYETMRAVVAAALDLGPLTDTSPPVSELAGELELVLALRRRCDYIGATRRLPGLVRNLHAASFGAERPDALRLMVRTSDAASFVVRFLGHPASAALVAERAQQAAQALDDPVMLGLAAYSRAHAAVGCGLYRRALLLAEAGATLLERHSGLANALPVRGQLLMTAALATYALGDVDGATTRVDEAQQLADHTGETDALWLSFGPTNIAFWRIGMETDGGDPETAVEIGRQTNPLLVESISKQTNFYLDMGRALARLGRDAEAVRMLVAAERMAPQRVRRNPLAAETTRQLLDRAQRNAGGSELRGLAERVGVLQ
jgi:transcriptional regulator with XRE-family HTH domain